MNGIETIDETLAIRFLLGELPEEERFKLEERFFQDDRFYEQLIAIQEELADDYVQDRLSEEDRALFETHFLRSPRRRDRVAFASAFSRALSGERIPAAAPHAPWWKSVLEFVPMQSPRMALAAVATALVVLAGGTWLLVENRRPSRDIQQAQTDPFAGESGEEAQRGPERASSAPSTVTDAIETEPREKPLAPEPSQTARSSGRAVPDSKELAPFVLSAAVTRGSEGPERLMIPAEARSIRLQLDLEREEDYESYEAEIRGFRGELAWKGSGLSLQRTSYGHAVVLTLSAELIRNGEFEVELKGVAGGSVEPVGYYFFTALER